jgi:hypothetical protein
MLRASHIVDGQAVQVDIEISRLGFLSSLVFPPPGCQSRPLNYLQNA